MHAIDTLITLADVRGSLDLRCQLQGDWALDHAQENPGIAPYHLVLAGQCQSELADGRRLELKAGDILIFPGGMPHWLHSEGKRLEASTAQIIDGGLLPIHRVDGDGAALDMLCGRFEYQRDAMLFAALPDYILLHSGDLHSGTHLPALVALLRSEADANQAGGQVIVNALSSALFALILRAHVQRQPQVSGTLALLQDKRLGRAWQAMLDDPARSWKVEDLAGLASMSRATFMRAFSKLAGVSPWVLLTRVRMEMACGLLSRSQTGLSNIAAQVGYQSQAAFSKVFKDTFGQSPGQFRKNL